MKTVTVTSKDGAAITGPVVLRLSRDQYAANAKALGALAGRGIYHLAEGQSVTLAHGETFGISVPEIAGDAIAPPKPATPKGKAKA